MTERRPRLPKHWVRAIAWITGGATFISLLGAFGIAPKPAASAPVRETPAPRKVIVRRIVRRVVIIDAPTAPVAASVPATVSASSGGSSYHPPSNPPASTSTGGSHP